MTKQRHITLTALLIATIIGLSGIMPCAAQRQITPVTNTPPVTAAQKKQPRPQRDPRQSLQKQTDAQGNIIFIDTITGREWTDSTAIKKAPRMEYPLIYCISAGINLWDPLMRLFGQQYGGASLWTELNMHNRYFPTLETGLGTARITPDGQNFTYRSPIAPYFKIGASYNIFYNSNPAYKLLVGLRYGFTAFRYNITDITVTDPYWDTTSHLDIPSQNATAGYLEILAGLRVQLIKHLSVGWNITYHTLLHQGGTATWGKPMYIPGYGKRTGAITASLSVSWTIPLNKPTTADVDTAKQKP